MLRPTCPHCGSKAKVTGFNLKELLTHWHCSCLTSGYISWNKDYREEFIRTMIASPGYTLECQNCLSLNTYYAIGLDWEGWKCNACGNQFQASDVFTGLWPKEEE